MNLVKIEILYEIGDMIDGVIDKQVSTPCQYLVEDIISGSLINLDIWEVIEDFWMFGTWRSDNNWKNRTPF